MKRDVEQALSQVEKLFEETIRPVLDENGLVFVGIMASDQGVSKSRIVSSRLSPHQFIGAYLALGHAGFEWLNQPEPGLIEAHDTLPEEQG